ncbi:MAG: hypothetical protein AAGH64_06805 [Planctomycetota bacterium]
MILTQTKAMFVDAFRELHARKLFWITMALSLIVVVVFALLGVDPNRGITFAWFVIPGFEEFAKVVPPDLFYRFWMITVGVNVWLSWVATIIALISTAGIVPAMVTSGAIDTMLSKPIGRVRLFLTKYLTGLLFTLAQVSIFVAGCVLVIGLRTGDWEWGLLLSIPIVTLFFSYLFAVSALVGLLSKSPLTAVLVTALIWFLIFVVNLVDAAMIDIGSGFEVDRDTARVQMISLPERIERLEAQLAEEEASGDAADSRTATRLENARRELEGFDGALEEAQENSAALDRWHRPVFGLKTVMPKTGETVGLISRWLIDTEELAVFFPDQFGSGGTDASLYSDDPQTLTEIKPRGVRNEETTRARGLGWVIGTSLIFEGVLLGIACLIFARRDF